MELKQMISNKNILYKSMFNMGATCFIVAICILITGYNLGNIFMYNAAIFIMSMSAAIFSLCASVKKERNYLMILSKMGEIK